MAYIGRDISNLSDRAVLDNITASATATYNLLLNGVAFVPSSAESLTVSLNGVIQRPQSSYTVNNATIVFDSALTSSDSIDFIIAERAITLTTVGTGTITPDKLASSVKSAVIWQSSVKTSSFTASSNEGYWVDTSSNTVTITFPSSPSVGDTIELVDYARNWGSNKIIIDSNTKNYQGDPDTFDVEYDTSGQALRVVYSGATKGWIPTSDEVSEDNPSSEYSVDFLVIAGGGGGSRDNLNGGTRGAGGGGAGGYRNSYNNETSGAGASSEASLTFNFATVYTITVGGGGAGGTAVTTNGSQGGTSSIAGSGITTISSVGGGGGGGHTTTGTQSGNAGGSGGGSSNDYPNGGAGTSGQGYGGGGGSGSPFNGGGGGGAGAFGSAGTGSSAGNGGSGVSSSITGSAVTRAGGGGGFGGSGSASGGSGGGGANGGAGTVNTGGGGGSTKNANGGAGGSGIVILRMPTAKYSGTTTGSPTVTTSGSDTILQFTGSGSYTG